MFNRYSTTFLLLTLVLVLPLEAQQVPEPANGGTTAGVYQIVGAPGGLFFARIDHDVIISPDSGVTWNPLHVPVDNSVEIFDILADEHRLWVATSNGVYGGGVVDGTVPDHTWERRNRQVHRILHLTPEGAVLGYDPTAMTVDRSIDGAGTWSTVGQGVGVLQFVTGSDGLLWMVTGDDVFTSSDDGRTWDRFSAGDDGEDISYLYPLDNGEVLALGATSVKQSRKSTGEWVETGTMPPHAGIVTAGFVRSGSLLSATLTSVNNPEWTTTYISGDTGRAWTDTYLFINHDDLEVQALLRLNDTVLLVGGTYHLKSSGLDVASFGQLVLAPMVGNPGTAQASFSGSFEYSQISSIFVLPDSSVVVSRFVHGHLSRELYDWIYRSEDWGGWWEAVSTTPYSATLSKTTTETLITTGLDVEKRSTDGGRTWEPIELPDDSWDPAGPILDYGGGRLLVNSAKDIDRRALYESTDDGITWEYIGDRPAEGTHGASVVAPDGVGYILEFKSVHITADTGRSWSTTRVVSEPQNWLTGLVINRDGDPVAVSVSGEVFRSEDRGMTWTGIAALEEVSFSSLFVDEDGTLFAGSRAGIVWRSHDNGTTWRSYASIPDTSAGAVLSLAVAPDRTMYIGTEFRGVWRVDMDQIGGIEERVRVGERLDLW